MSTQSARTLRQQMSGPERRLWYLLRRKQIEGFRFRRQQPIDRYIVDFVCLKERLVIELDGGSHVETEGYDKVRTAWLEAKGYRVLRFWNNDVMGNQEGVIEVILEALHRRPSSPLPHPPPEVGGGD
ncbi:endonuclease domain-containing protein [Hypericibacter adhaerens]|nr:endonuclease domain-containing protein [Hypericibacter adhaerens]